jgi:hypothetical protein
MANGQRPQLVMPPPRGVRHKPLFRHHPAQQPAIAPPASGRAGTGAVRFRVARAHRSRLREIDQGEIHGQPVGVDAELTGIPSTLRPTAGRQPSGYSRPAATSLHQDRLGIDRPDSTVADRTSTASSGRPRPALGRCPIRQRAAMSMATLRLAWPKDMGAGTLKLCGRPRSADQQSELIPQLVKTHAVDRPLSTGVDVSVSLCRRSAAPDEARTGPGRFLFSRTYRVHSCSVQCARSWRMKSNS